MTSCMVHLIGDLFWMLQFVGNIDLNDFEFLREALIGTVAGKVFNQLQSLDLGIKGISF